MTFREFIDQGLDTPMQEITGALVQVGLILLGGFAVVVVIAMACAASFWAYKRWRYDRVHRRSQPRIRLRGEPGFRARLVAAARQRK